jgi:cysteinyl-tRNA synthetase
MQILDIVEGNLKKADDKFKSWDEVFGKMSADKKAAEELKKAIEAVKDTVNKALADAFTHPEDISWGTAKFAAAAGQAYLKTGEQPEIKRLSRKTGSWLSGMHVTCEFEVLASDGTSFGKFTFQDRGLDGPDGHPVAGFRPMD